MARVASSFRCLVCEKKLEFPDNITITKFMILILQFYETHELCEMEEQVITSSVSNLNVKGKRKKKH